MAVAKVWNGSEWVPTKWKTHNGSEWIEQSKVWDGSEWVPIKGAPPVLFDAVGAGGSGESAEISNHFSWTHTASGEGRAVVVSVAGQAFGDITGITATYGDTPMTALTERGFNNRSSGRTQQFILLNPPTGAQTVQVTVTRSEGVVGASYAIANSVSYNHVGAYTQGASSHGIGASRSLTVTTAGEGDMVVQAFGHQDSAGMSDYSQTQRSNLPGSDRPGGFIPVTLLIGDSDEGDNNISFTATGIETYWSGVSVILHPA